MRYLRAFQFSENQKYGRTIYPYNSLNAKSGELLVFDGITMIYGGNGSGKSTFLNSLAHLLKIDGAEHVKVSGKKDYFTEYLSECVLMMDDQENGGKQKLPENMRYIKSEDILYEVKKIQQEAILREGYHYKRRQLGMTKAQYDRHEASYQMEQQIDRHLFAQEKYSNGEMAMQVFEDYLQPKGIYLLDEPEVSLSPDRQLELANIINDLVRFFDVQIIIASHSPLLLGALEGTIYNFSEPYLCTSTWKELPIVSTYHQFFTKKFAK